MHLIWYAENADLYKLAPGTFDEIEHFSSFTSDIIDARNEWHRLIYSYSQVLLRVLLVSGSPTDFSMIINKIVSTVAYAR